MSSVNDRFLEKFSGVWKGGYLEGDPRDPMAASTYGVYGYNSILYTVYLTCIRPYVGPGSTVLEIGPGRGAWTKTFLDRGCKKVYALDAAPPEKTHFWEYVGHTDRVAYETVSDFELAPVPDDSIDFFFSFGVFCHLKPQMCESYIRSLARKMRPGAKGFLMIADFDKYMACLANADHLSVKRILAEQTRKVWMPARIGYLFAWKHFRSKMDLEPVSKDRDVNLAGDGTGAGWYHWGVDRACQAIERAGFLVIERDVEVIPRDPVIHFARPSNGS